MHHTSRILTALFLLLTPQLLFPQLFGQNRVQYTHFDWHYIQSRHFDVYFYPGAEQLAGFVADVAESSYISLSENWHYRLRDRLVIILYKSHNDFGQSNLNYGPPEESVGGFTEFFKNRVVIPYEGSYEQLRHVTHHELTHAMMLQMLFGTAPQSIISGVASSRIPLWFIEGLAEYESRGWDTESDMFIRDAVIHGYLPPIEHLNGFLAYKGGQSVLNFIAEKYGPQKVGELLVKLRYTKSIEHGFQQSLGIGLAELNDRWHKYVRKKYWPDFADRQEPGDFAKQITFHTKEHNFINNSGALSPQGDRIAYLSDKSGFFDIYLVSAIDGRELAKLVSGQRSGKLEELHWLRPGITWDPDGKRIAFAAKSQEQDALHIVDVEEQEIVESYKFGLDGVYSPDWGPDGRRIAFVGAKDGQSDIYIYRFDSGKLSQVTDDLFSDLEPRWSPDGARIAFVSDRGDRLQPDTLPTDFQMQDINYHQSDVYTVDVRTGEITRITTTPTNEKSPAWSPEGDRLAFVSDRSGIYNIYITPASEVTAEDDSVLAAMGFFDREESGGGAEAHANASEGAYPITNVLTGINHLSWQGDRLAFTCFYHGGFDIYVMQAPSHVRPGEIQPKYTTFMKERLQSAGGNGAAKGNGAKKEPTSVPTDTAHNSYENFVFGRAFKEGRPTSASEPDPELFLQPEEYKTAAGEYRVNKYKTQFSADIITGGAGYDPFFGLQGASMISFSDLMGNHRINILTDFFIDFKNSDFALTYFYMPRQTDFGIGIFHRAFLFFSQGRFLVRDRNLGLKLMLLRPLDRYRRWELRLDVLRIVREGMVDFEGEDPGLGDQSRNVVLAGASYVKDNVIWGMTGPKAGTRYTLSVTASPDLGPNGLDFRIYQADFRHYVNFAKEHTLALRLAAGLSEGRQAQKFFLGGLYNWINLDFRDDVQLALEDIYFSNFVMPLRGADYYERVGSKFFLANVEVRVPFVRHLLMHWPLPLRFSNLRGTIFLDVGSAWDGKLSVFKDGSRRLDDVLMSFGWGARLNMGLFLLKYDMAWRTDLVGTSSPRHLFSIGADF